VPGAKPALFVGVHGADGNFDDPHPARGEHTEQIVRIAIAGEELGERESRRRART
jgi:hypothetical protein